jgi:PIN domain nuclease of toxin-antitoxin system
MSKPVLDASAILAAMLSEQGGDAVGPMLATSIVSAVNVAEVLSKLSENGMLDDETVSDFRQLGLEIVDYDIEQAVKVAELGSLTKHLGLSLGDRSCLALAILRDATAITADRSWTTLTMCRIACIR